jgi:hypothetical protein
MDDLEQRLDQILDSGELNADRLGEIMALAPEIMSLPPDHPGRDRILAKLQGIVGDQPASPAMNIADYYRAPPYPLPYVLQWPLAPQTLAAMPMPFEALDHKTQFYVLFQEWTRRELDANLARDSGDPRTAIPIFEECLARAEQLDVAELRARSHAGLASVYEMLEDRQAARRELQAEMAEREAAVR